MEIEIDSAYLMGHGNYDAGQMYLLELDLMENTIENVNKWEEIFSRIDDGRKLKLTLEWFDERDE